MICFLFLFLFLILTLLLFRLRFCFWIWRSNFFSFSRADLEHEREKKKWISSTYVIFFLSIFFLAPIYYFFFLSIEKGSWKNERTLIYVHKAKLGREKIISGNSFKLVSASTNQPTFLRSPKIGIGFCEPLLQSNVLRLQIFRCRLFFTNQLFANRRSELLKNQHFLSSRIKRQTRFV